MTTDPRFDNLPPELGDLADLASTFAHAASAGRSPARRAAPAPRARGARAPASYVIDRHGAHVPIRFDLITERNEVLRSEPHYGPELATIDTPLVTAEVVRRFRNGMTTRELDAETAAICIQRSTYHSDYEWLAARIYVSDLQKRTPEGLSGMIDAILAAAPDRTLVRLSDEFVAVVRRAEARVAARLDPGRDYRLRFFGYQTVSRSYLLRPGPRRGESSLLDDQLMERPQHLYMRVALGVFVCQPDGRGHEAPEADFDRRLADAFEFYDALSLQRVSNATPTMLNTGTNVSQLSSCFQLATGDDLPTLYDTLKSAALASKWSGGVSVWLHNVRAEGAPIRKTGGRSTGIKRYVRLWNDTQLYVDQGGNRPGAFAVYLGVDHDDIFTFLAVARRKGEEALKGLDSPDLKYALWVPDLFMEALTAQLENGARVAAGGPDDPTAGDWHLFDPDAAPGLHLAWGGEYRALVARYVAEGRYRRRVKAGDIVAEAFKTWAQVGVPYVLYKDHINRKSNMRNVAPVCSSNLCVAGDTLVLTDRGHLPIASLQDQEVNVWNGAVWSAVIVRRTNDAASLVRVELDSGASLDCTPYHKFYVYPADAGRGARETRAGMLQPGDRLEKSPRWPLIEGGEPLPHAYTSGFFAADGHYTEERARCQNPADAEGGDFCRHHARRRASWPRDGTCRAWCGYNAVNLYGRKKALLDALDVHPDCAGLYQNAATDRLTVNLVDELLPKDEVPLEASVESKVEWFAGLCDGGGCAIRQGTTYGICVSSVNRDFLLKVRLMLQTLGCDPRVGPMNGARRTVIGGVRYDCRACYRLLLTPEDLDALLDSGFCPMRLAFPGFVPPRKDARHPAKVVSVTPLPGEHTTYCFTEPLLNRGVFNGVRCGNCCEILIPSWSDFDAPQFARFHPGNDPAKGEFGVCNLAAVCLESFLVGGADGRLSLDYAGVAAAAGLEVRALNRVIDLSFYPSEECRRSNRRHRPVGVGIMGLADVLVRLGLVYGSPEARAVARGVAAAVYYGALLESTRLAEAEGPYSTFAGSPLSEGRLQPDLWVEAGDLAEGWEGEVAATTGGALSPEMWAALRAAARRGARNAYVTAYMPTATTSNIVGQNECFEPFTSNIYTRRTLAGEFFVVNRHLMAELGELGLWDEAMRRAVLAAGGSVQGIGRVPAELRRRYRTAREIHPSLVIRMVAAMAPFVCQSMSMNLFLDEPGLPKILRFLVEGWHAGLKTALYYCHTRPAAGSQKTSVRTEVASTRSKTPPAAETAPQAPICSLDGVCASCAV